MEERTSNFFEPLDRHSMQRSIIVAGMPRGGTTLLGSIINSLENSYCISEPMAIEEQLHLAATPEEFLERTRAYFQEQRKQILTTGKTLNRIGRDGRPVTNYFKRADNNIIVNEYIETEETVSILDANFTLAVKHNAHFLSILPLFCNAPDMSVIGIIRHPIPTILSWRSLDLPISKGRLPSGEKFWPELLEVASSSYDILLRQVMIYELIASRLLAYREKINLLCYENLVDNPGQLGTLINQQVRDALVLESRNRSNEYNWEDIRIISSTLKAHAPNTTRIYSISDLDSPAVF